MGGDETRETGGDERNKKRASLGVLVLVDGTG
jgi:hypothetical protein